MKEQRVFFLILSDTVIKRYRGFLYRLNCIHSTKQVNEYFRTLLCFMLRLEFETPGQQFMKPVDFVFQDYFHNFFLAAQRGIHRSFFK